VRAYLEETLSALGSAALRKHRFTWQGVEGLNLVAEMPAMETGRPILIGAHYDSVPGSPGADDNASGVAVMLELARLLDREPVRRPVWLVAFDLEEWGMRGSAALAEELKRTGPRPSWMASLEMLGYRRVEPRTQAYPFPFGWFYPNRGDFVLMLGNFPAHRLMGRMARVFDRCGVRTERFTVPLRGWAIPGSRLSDQSPFWDMGVAGVMLTDTAWLRNPHYHGPTDRADTLDLGFMADTVEALGDVLRSES
jgi:Zn-dependent M28 family amino/carboxypeptidase